VEDYKQVIPDATSNCLGGIESHIFLIQSGLEHESS